MNITINLQESDLSSIISSIKEVSAVKAELEALQASAAKYCATPLEFKLKPDYQAKIDSVENGVNELISKNTEQLKKAIFDSILNGESSKPVIELSAGIESTPPIDVEAVKPKKLRASKKAKDITSEVTAGGSSRFLPAEPKFLEINGDTAMSFRDSILTIIYGDIETKYEDMFALCSLERNRLFLNACSLLRKTQGENFTINVSNSTLLKAVANFLAEGDKRHLNAFTARGACALAWIFKIINHEYLLMPGKENQDQLQAIHTCIHAVVANAISSSGEINLSDTDPAYKIIMHLDKLCEDAEWEDGAYDILVNFMTKLTNKITSYVTHNGSTDTPTYDGLWEFAKAIKNEPVILPVERAPSDEAKLVDVTAEVPEADIKEQAVDTDDKVLDCFTASSAANRLLDVNHSIDFLLVKLEEVKKNAPSAYQDRLLKTNNLCITLKKLINTDEVLDENVKVKLFNKINQARLQEKIKESTVGQTIVTGAPYND